MRYLILHGHFYQPPRENPFWGEIPKEARASLSHDWNERITKECYSPNAYSRILDLGRKLSEIFEYSISNAEYDYGKNILYSPSMNVSYFGNDTEKIEIKNLKNIYERKLKKLSVMKLILIPTVLQILLILIIKYYALKI